MPRPNAVGVAMYVVTNHSRKIAEWSSPENLREVIPDLSNIMAQNAAYRRVMAEKAVGRPGHYYGKDAVIEGAMPISAFLAAEAEYGGDPKWWRDDRKFQDFLKRNPGYSWMNG